MLICGKSRLDKEEGKSRHSRRGLGEQEQQGREGGSRDSRKRGGEEEQ